METIISYSQKEDLHEFLPMNIPKNLPMGLIIYDKDLNIAKLNQQAENLFGYTESEILGKSLLGSIVPKDQSTSVDLWRRKIAFSTFNITTFYRNINKQKEFIACNWHTTPIIDDSKQISGYISLVEKAIPDHLNLNSFDHTDILKSFIENTSFNVIVNFETQEIEYVNPAVLYSYSLLNNFHMEKGFEILRFIPQNERFRIIRHFKSRAADRKNVNISFHLQVGYSVLLPIHLTGHYLNINSKTVYVLTVTLPKNDNLLRKSATNAKSYSRQLFSNDIENLQKRNNLELLGDLTAGVVHEINQPLGVLKIILDSFKQKLEAGSMSREFLAERCEMAQANITRINELIDEIRIFRKEVRCNDIKKVNLIKPLCRVLDLLKMAFASNKIKIVTDIQADLPVIVANEKWLTTIFTNLLANAKYSLIQKGAMQNDLSFNREIKITTWYDEERVNLQVSDNGMGIKSKHFDSLFDPFFTTKGKQGSGLGLAIVKNYIKELNGSIEVDSQEGLYATFTISFPRID
ncbi:MAG: PAS domain S-box protein [Bacteroidales bacterium]|nr:PAS domain S-box protein [Bacteroidales bacterium]